jgi:hypothetical protein
MQLEDEVRCVEGVQPVELDPEIGDRVAVEVTLGEGIAVDLLSPPCVSPTHRLRGCAGVGSS